MGRIVESVFCSKRFLPLSRDNIFAIRTIKATQRRLNFVQFFCKSFVSLLVLYSIPEGICNFTKLTFERSMTDFSKNIRKAHANNNAHDTRLTV